MTFSNLTSGVRVRRKTGVVVNFRWVMLLAVFSVGAVSNAFAQGPFTAMLLPSDSGTRSIASPADSQPVIKPIKSSGFVREQIEYDRVLEARVEKRFEMKKLFRERGLTYPAAEIFMRVFKREQVLEMWVRPQQQDSFVLLKSYEICALSEKPGPKVRQGDLQTPEGFYTIDDFNPQSDYHLSLRVNYPNQADRIRGVGETLGGDIFIHGGCKTAGCMALTDENIKEVYVLAMEARDHGQQQIPVHIFPSRLTDDGLKRLVDVFHDKDLTAFWTNLKDGYDLFEQTHTLPKITVSRGGRYQFNGGLLGTPAGA